MGARKKEALEQFNRENILNAAKSLFETKGIEHTTMDDIAEYADYSKSTIYVYFRSKEDIYNSILNEYMEKLVEEITECIEQEEDFEECYYSLCNCLVEFEEQYPDYYQSILGENKAVKSRKKSVMVTEPGNEICRLVSVLIEKGIDNEVIREDIELKPTVLYVMSAISGIIQVAGNKKDSLDTRVDMNKEEYLRYSFRTFYDSLVKR